MLTFDSIQVNIKTPKTGASAVWIAAQEGHVGVIQVLGDHDCDVNATNKRGVTFR